MRAIGPEVQGVTPAQDESLARDLDLEPSFDHVDQLLARMENLYSPPIGALNEPIAQAAQALLANPQRGGQ